LAKDDSQLDSRENKRTAAIDHHSPEGSLKGFLILNQQHSSQQKGDFKMSQSIAIQKTQDKILEQVITKGDLADLSPEQKVSYYNAVCQSLGLNPITRPFEYIQLQENGKPVVKLYARKDATEQLRKINQISIWKIENVIEDGCLIVTAYARTPDGREDIDEGIVYIKGKVGDSLANLQMKAITKAKRRVTLSICGLGFLDESEIDSIPNAQPVASPEQEAIMTESEAEQLTLSHKASGLDQWKCGRALAMQILSFWAMLQAGGAEEETLRGWLPNGIASRKDLTEEQARAVIKVFQSRLDVIRQASLDQWQCAPDLAIRLMMVYGELIARGVDKETIQQRLPDNSPSFRALSEAQAQEALKTFTHWLKTYNDIVQGEVVNNG